MSSKRILIVGDSPRISTGFGRVNSEAVKAFRSKGWEVAALEGLTDKTSDLPQMPDITTFTPSVYKGDIWGFHDIQDVIKKYKPDLIYTTADPGTFVTASSMIPAKERFLGYVVIEGEPIANMEWRRMLSVLPFFTASAYGAGIVKRDLNRDIDYVYHGVDHELFNTNARNSGMRERIRKEVGWQDKFILMAVATNVRRKQIPRLIEALSILKYQYKQKDIALYLHTVPFQHYWLDGWNLPEVTRLFGVDDLVMFHPAMNKMNASVPLITGKAGYPGLVEMMNSADLFVSAAQVEGFGLPPAEAMACGLPVVVPKYAAGWEVVSPAGRGVPMHDWEIHKSSTKYGNIDPHDMAKEILRLRRNPKELARMSEAGINRAQDFQWSKFHEVLIEQAEKVMNAPKINSTGSEKTNTRKKSREKKVQPTAVEGENNLPQDIVQPEGQDKGSNGTRSQDQLVA